MIIFIFEQQANQKTVMDQTGMKHHITGVELTSTNESRSFITDVVDLKKRWSVLLNKISKQLVLWGTSKKHLQVLQALLLRKND